MEPIIHLFLPAIVLLAIYPNIPKKYVLGLAPLAVLADFDLFVGGWHRLLFHNLFFVILVALLVYALWNKRAFFIALYYTLSHLILDFAYPGSAWLYPLVQKTFYVEASVLKGQEFFFNFWVGSLSFTEFSQATQWVYSTWFTTLGFILVSLIFILIISKLGRRS
ncbi:hypothetical protein HOD38_03270 [archaeon]|jgi:hypothetical protein|nr:hypothetical protein [archaeon]MBT4397260.1 hypothetical protein [archaeon]MBT4440640.1 hypothetical protein [archaeon]